MKHFLPSAVSFLLTFSGLLHHREQWILCQSFPDLSDPCASSATQLHNADIAYFPTNLLPTEEGSEQPTSNGDSEDGEVRRRRGATSQRHKLWTNGTVYYAMSDRFTSPERRTIMEAMKHWEDFTCIRFKERTTQTAYVNYFPGTGCCSYVGRVGNSLQGVSLARSCFTFHTVLHEIGHVVGFWHEQSRPDRDQHVQILYGNVIPLYQLNFKKIPSYLIDSQGVGYDYNSIMHYNSNFFSRHHTLDTIRARDPSIPLGQARVLSQFDIEQTNRLYKCDTANMPPPSVMLPPPLPTPSPFPRLPYPCGSTMSTIQGSFSSPGYPHYGSRVNCAWMIKLPDGYKVRLTFAPVGMENTYGCYKDSIRVYDNFHRTGTGRTICGYYYSYYYTVSGGSALIHYHTDHYNDFSTTPLAGFRASYQAVDINECLDVRCSHGCRNLIGSYECTCPRGFYLSADGVNCFDMNECALGNGGCEHRCVNTGGSYRCECPSDYELQPDGRSCRLPGTSCSIHNGGCHHACTETPTAKICSCNPGYKLHVDGVSCLDKNECYRGQSGCHHICTNIRGSYVCSCREGFKLNSDNHTCSLDRTCADGNGGCHQRCRDTITGAICSCKRGYRLARDQRTCEDINECVENRRICQGICTNNNGSYTCSCTEGLSLEPDGRRCSDINECATGDNLCPFQDRCTNTYGSYVCNCPAGYTTRTNGRGCDDIDECALGYDLFCSHSCHNLPGTFECHCPPGYILQDTYTCRDVDECISRTHNCNQFSGATCRNTIGSYSCVCPDGYSVDSSGFNCIESYEFECESIEECDEGFVCAESEGNEYMTCQCPSGYMLSEDGFICEDVRSTESDTETTPTTQQTRSTSMPTTRSTTDPYTRTVGTSDLPTDSSGNKTDAPISTKDKDQQSKTQTTTHNNEPSTTASIRTPDSTTESVQTGTTDPTTQSVQTGTTDSSTQSVQTGTPDSSTQSVQTGTTDSSTQSVQTGTTDSTTQSVQTGTPDSSTQSVQTGTPDSSTQSVQTGTPDSSTPGPSVQTGPPDSSTQSVQSRTPDSSTPPVQTGTPGSTTQSVQTGTTDSSTQSVQSRTPDSSTPPVQTGTPDSTTQSVQTGTTDSSTQSVQTGTTDSSTPGPSVQTGTTDSSTQSVQTGTTDSTTQSVQTGTSQHTPSLNTERSHTPSTDSSQSTTLPTMTSSNYQPTSTSDHQTTVSRTEVPSTKEVTDALPTTVSGTLEDADHTSEMSQSDLSTEPPSDKVTQVVETDNTNDKTQPSTEVVATSKGVTQLVTNSLSPTISTTVTKEEAKVTSSYTPSTEPNTSSPTMTSTPEPPCGGKVTEVNGSFHTINWPETYPVNIDCEWKIELPDSNKAIAISFDQTAFGIAGRLPDCTKDWIKIYDGHSYNDSWWGPFCYFWKPKPFQTNSHKALVSFHSGPRHTRSRKGFRLIYSSVEKPTTETPEMPTVTTTNHPTTWRTTTVQHATTTIDSLDSSKTTDETDTLTTQHETSTDLSEIEEVCTIPPPPLEPQGAFRCVVFVYPNGKFGPPGFPNLITSQSTCAWYLLGAADKKYQLEFLYFDLPLSPNCTENSFKLFDGFNTNAKPIATLCGYLEPERRTVKCTEDCMLSMWRLKIASRILKTIKGFLTTMHSVEYNYVFPY